MTRRVRRNHTPAFKAKAAWQPSRVGRRWRSWRISSMFTEPAHDLEGSGALSNTRRFISEPTTASARPALRSAVIWTSTTASARIRALMPGRQITPTPTACRRSRQHDFRRRFRGVTLVGLRPPGVPPRKRNPTAIGRDSTYRERKSVQTKPATSVGHLSKVQQSVRCWRGGLGIAARNFAVEAVNG
jgi:hypothetical protein